MSLLSSFKRSVREAGAPLADAGWMPRGVGLIHHHDNGYWGQIVFGGASRPADPLVVNLTAGVCSPFLLEVVSRQDPTRPPGNNFVAGDASVLWCRVVTYRAIGPSFPPMVLDPETDDGRSPIEISPASAPGWLAETFAKVAPLVDALCSDRALRDRLLEGTADRPPTTFKVRCAALLTRRLGEDDKLTEVLAIAEELDARDLERFPRSADGIRLLGDPDDQTLYPQDWSHARFLQFMEETAGLPRP